MICVGCKESNDCNTQFHDWQCLDISTNSLAKITKDLRLHGLLPESVEFLSPSQVGGLSEGFSGHQGAVRSVANQMELKTGEMPTLAAAASELGKRGNQGTVRRMAKRMELKTGVMPALEAAAS